MGIIHCIPREEIQLNAFLVTQLKVSVTLVFLGLNAQKTNANVPTVLHIQDHLLNLNSLPQWFLFIPTKYYLLAASVVPWRLGPGSVKFSSRKGIPRTWVNSLVGSISSLRSLSSQSFGKSITKNFPSSSFTTSRIFLWSRLVLLAWEGEAFSKVNFLLDMLLLKHFALCTMNRFRVVILEEVWDSALRSTLFNIQVLWMVPLFHWTSTASLAMALPKLQVLCIVT